MLAQAEATGVTHLLLSPWIMLIPVHEEPATAGRICRVQNEGLAQATTKCTSHVYGLGAVPLQNTRLAITELGHLMSLPHARHRGPASIRGSHLGDNRFAPFWSAAAGLGAVVFLHPTYRARPACARWLLPVEFGRQPAGDRNRGRPACRQRRAGALPGPDSAARARRRCAAFPCAADCAGRTRSGQRRGRAPRPGRTTCCVVYYFDSLTHDQAVLINLLTFAGAHHVLLGSDQPFDVGTDRPVDEVGCPRVSARQTSS